MKKENLIKVFAGSESSVILLQSRLEDIGVASIVKNDSSDAFLGIAPQVIDLYINKTDLRKSNPVIRGFIEKIT